MGNASKHQAAFPGQPWLLHLHISNSPDIPAVLHCHVKCDVGEMGQFRGLIGVDISLYRSCIKIYSPWCDLRVGQGGLKNMPVHACCTHVMTITVLGHSNLLSLEKFVRKGVTLAFEKSCTCKEPSCKMDLFVFMFYLLLCVNTLEFNIFVPRKPTCFCET